MAWTYYCDMEGITLSAPTKEELAVRVLDHMREAHNTDMTEEQTRESVEKNAKQTAA